MESFSVLMFLVSFLNIRGTISTEGGKVFIVVLDKGYTKSPLRIEENIIRNNERMVKDHDNFLKSLFAGTEHTKLYSYTHLLNGFAVHVTSDEAIHSIKNAEGVRVIHEDIIMKKSTTYTPEYLGIPTGVWPTLGGAQVSGEGVVIGLIDTGINPSHPSFQTSTSHGIRGSILSRPIKFNGKCAVGNQFPLTACNGKIVGARYFARAAIAAGKFNITRDYASPFDADGHGSHTASTAAGNHQVPVRVNNFTFGYASGMAPGARIAVCKAMYCFGGFMSDVVAAIDQAVKDGVDILSLSVGPAGVPYGHSAFLNALEMELLFAVKAGVLVVQAAGNGGPSSSSLLSFSPWITTVAASITDRKYNNSIELGNGQHFIGIGLAPPTAGEMFFPLVAAADVGIRNTSVDLWMTESCQSSLQFVRSLVQGRLIICRYPLNLEFGRASIATIADTIRDVGAAGFILTMNPYVASNQIQGGVVTLQVPGVILNNLEESLLLWDYYNSNTGRSRSGRAIDFRAWARILDGRRAIYTGQAPVVASYSSRGPVVNNALFETADLLKPNIMAPGSSIWAAWSPTSEGDEFIKGQSFALLSGTSMATPHIAGIAALIKQKHPDWSPSAITSAMMTTADVSYKNGAPILAQDSNRLSHASPFDFGAGFVNPSKAIDPGLVFDISFKDYVQFLCSVPGLDEKSVRQAVGVQCPTKKKWCSDLNTASVTVSHLIGKRKVIRRVTNVGNADENYSVIIREPLGVKVRVSPQSFKISVNASRCISLSLTATQTSNAYTFGEMLLHGDRKHLVRVPISVSVGSSLGL